MRGSTWSAHDESETPLLVALGIPTPPTSGELPFASPRTLGLDARFATTAGQPFAGELLSGSRFRRSGFVIGIVSSWFGFVGRCRFECSGQIANHLLCTLEGFFDGVAFGVEQPLLQPRGFVGKPPLDDIAVARNRLHVAAVAILRRPDALRPAAAAAQIAAQTALKQDGATVGAVLLLKSSDEDDESRDQWVDCPKAELAGLFASSHRSIFLGSDGDRLRSSIKAFRRDWTT